MFKENLIKIKGFKGNGIHSKVKYKKLDLGIVYSEKPCIAAGVFTKNKTCAAPVKISKINIKNPINAIIINSGNANACTGKEGHDNALNMCKQTSKNLGINPENVLIASTGIIGKQLPMDKISSGIDEIVKDINYDNFNLLPEAIKTTDKTDKICSSEFQIGNHTIKINGFAKGSGMIHPNMATTLGFITTNVNISKSLLQKLLTELADVTFNMISVDGDTSTNDTIIALSNQSAENEKITSPDSISYLKFKKHLHEVLQNLAIMVVKDGEGATKLLTVTLKGARTKNDAKKQAKSIITSSLVKSAFFGEDVNWGRIVCSLGNSLSSFDPNKVFLSFKANNKEIILMKNGEPKEYRKEIAEEIMSSDEIEIYVNVNLGNYSAKSWGCDLSYDYVKINASYS